MNVHVSVVAYDCLISVCVQTWKVLGFYSLLQLLGYTRVCVCVCGMFNGRMYSAYCLCWMMT